MTPAKIWLLVSVVLMLVGSLTATPGIDLIIGGNINHCSTGISAPECLTTNLGVAMFVLGIFGFGAFWLLFLTPLPDTFDMEGR